ncbi:hypothetical protein XcmpCFBP7700_02825 [Xanthomonas campestris]|nr:hypothetical protein XcmpCFBP7700_02825 [Xanthomonas campestris]
MLEIRDAGGSWPACVLSPKHHPLCSGHTETKKPEIESGVGAMLDERDPNRKMRAWMRRLGGMLADLPTTIFHH